MKKMKGAKIAAVIGLTALSFSLPTYAGLTIVADYSKEAERFKNKENFNFSQVGLSGEEVYVVEGMGNDMPLDIATGIIAPNGWSVDITEGAEKELVDWDGGKAWPYVMRDLAERNDLLVEVNWVTRELTVVSVTHEEDRLAQLQKDIEIAKVIERQKEEALLKEKEEVLKKEQEKVALEKQRHQEELAKLEAQEAAKKERLDSIRAQYEVATVLPGNGTFEEYLEASESGSEVETYSQAVYVIDPSLSLKENLNKWSGSIKNWKFVDNTNSTKDYFFETEVRLKGNFIEVTGDLLSKYKNSQFPLNVNYHVGDGSKYTIELIRYQYNEK